MILADERPELGARIRDLRRACALSQLELAALAGVSARHLSFVENGRSRPSRKVLLRLAEGLEAAPDLRDSLLVKAGYAPLADPAGPLAGRTAVAEYVAGVHGAGGPAAAAGRRVLERAPRTAVSALVLAGGGPGTAATSAAAALASRLGLRGVAAFGVEAGCGGFLYGLATATGLIASGAAGRVLLIGAHRDAGGALLLRAGVPAEPGAVVRVALGGSGEPDASGSPLVVAGRLHDASREVLRTAGWAPGDLALSAAHTCAHDAPAVLDPLAVRLRVPAARRHHASGPPCPAALPLLLADTVAAAPGSRVLLAAGSGGAWGAAALRWPPSRP
ncbi:helix-turn-helix domain-containing protein [Streptomyces sp. NPDC089922]|uniref:helix-turn-helix domain-containing protein n=1 Tax=unclassified Streptomyces TaxID=2593676 RepID=UPI0034460B70